MDGCRVRVVVFAWVALVGSWQTATAAAPELATLVPRGGQRGTEFEIKLTGDQIDQVENILFSRPGLQLIEYQATDDETATAIVRSDENCPLGEHPLWLVGPRGASKLASLHIGPFVTIDESEPNNRNSEVADQKIDLGEGGVTLVGALEGPDVDCFAFDLQAGERLSAELEGMRLGSTFLDAHLEIVDPAGKVVVANDDNPLHGQDPLVTYVATTDGVHVLRVREAAFDADYDVRYRVHVGHFARPIVCYPCGGRLGEQLTTTFIGDSRGDFAEAISLPLGSSGFHRHYPVDGTGIVAPSPVCIRVSDHDNVFEVEPNNTVESATKSDLARAAFNGVLAEEGDRDYYAIKMAQGAETVVELFGSRVGSPIDSVVEVFAPDGQLVARNDDGQMHDSTVRFTAHQGGVYAIAVHDHLHRGGSQFVYRMEYGPVRPSLVLALASSELEPTTKPAAITVPRGGRSARLVSARRADCDGPVEVDVATAPDDVAVAVSQIRAENHLSMLLLQAAPDAKLGAQFLTITGYSDSPSGTVEGDLKQKVGVVFGEPRQTIYHQIELDRIPIVVTEPAPIAIEAEVPTVAIAQDGALDVHINLVRASEFLGPVAFSAVRLPPWMEIEEQQPVADPNETRPHIRLIADARATPGVYPLVLSATTTVDGGEVAVASQQFDFGIAEPHAEVHIAPASAEQGTPVDVPCRIDWRRPAQGKVTAYLRGLPKHAEAPAIELAPGESQVVFPVTLGAECPASIHNTLYVELAISSSLGESHEYSGRGGVLEVFPKGGQPRDKLSPLERLRRQARSESGRHTLATQ